MKYCFILMFVFSFVLGLEAQDPILYFSSQVDIPSVFIEKVEAEQKSIKLVSYRLSDVGVVQALIKAHQRGVLVEVIVDSVAVTKNSPLKLLVKEGVSVLVWSPSDKKRMNYGFCVFGSSLSWTGSYNFSLKSGSKSFEDVLLLEDEKVASAFLKEFENIKKQDVIPFLSVLKERELARK